MCKNLVARNEGGLLKFCKGSRGVYHKCTNLIFFCINILITNKDPYTRHCCFKLPFGKLKGHETGRPCTIRGPGNELETFVLLETDPYDHT